MTTIQANKGVVTQVNVFTVPEGGQQALIDFLKEAALVASEVDGWISASLHRSFDGTRVVNYAQSRDMESAKRVIEHLAAKGYLEANKALGTAHPGLYEVVFTLEK